MAQVVQATCPSCKKVLRIPADWVQKSLRCKNCGTILQVRRGSSPPPLPTAADNETSLQQPVPDGPSPAPTGPDEFGFASDLNGPIIRAPLRGQPSKRLRPAALLFAGAFLLAVVAAVAYQLWPPLSNSAATLPVPPKKNPPANLLPESVVFPRRVLAISVNHYLYANPINSPNVHDLMQRMARVLHIPASQMVELSDVIPPRPIGKGVPEKPARDARPPEREATPTAPLRPILEKTIRSFLETSRPQDHILLLFAGHVVEISGEAYLVPLEGELDVKETLIPLTWLYEQLARCKARQKVLILDTCRFDPSHGRARPGSGPMTATLDALLQKPPSGVQLWSTCMAGQFSYESDGNGVFLEKLHDALTPSVLKKTQQPEDALPMEALAETVNTKTATEVATRITALDGKKAVQSPRLSGQMAEQVASYDKDEPLPPAFEIPAPTLPAGGVAKQEQVQRILEEIDLPAIRPGQYSQRPGEMAALLPFSAEVIERYRPDDGALNEIEQDAKRHPLRVQVIATIQLLRTVFDPIGPQGSLRETFQGASNERIKAAILKEQRKPAQILEQLTERLEELRKAGEQRDQEPSPRWQAHYDYILAQLLARTAYMSEYNLMLGKIRRDELPQLQSKVHTGWRLGSSEKIQSGKDVKELAAESKKIFAKLLREHPGTPWEVLAKRERLTALGLEWQPSS